MSERFSRHTNDQYRWRERTIERLNVLDGTARALRLTQADYLERREAILTSPDAQRLTRVNRAACRDYERALSHARWRELVFCWRLPGQPETATPSNWDDLSEPLREACRNNTAEGAHCWEAAGTHPWGPWEPWTKGSV